MGFFKRTIENTVIDYLDRTVDTAGLKAISSNAMHEIKFFNLALNIASTYIASAISSCKFKVHAKDKLIKDTVYYKLNIAPNPNETATSLKYQMVKELVKKGKAVVVKYNNYLYFAEDFTLDNESIFGYEFTGITVQKTLLSNKFKRKHVFYFKLDDEEIERLLRRVDEDYKKVLSTAIKSYKRSINNKWKLGVDSAKIGTPDEESDFEQTLNNDIKSFIESDEGVYFETYGYKLDHLNINSDKDSSDIRNLRKDIFDMVAQAFKIPISMMYGNVTNLKEVVNQFITFSVKPYANMIGEELTRILFNEDEILNGKYVEVDISSINYRDIFDVADKVDKLIYSGTTNIDEARELVNMPQLNTDWSNQHWMTKNNGKIEDVMRGVVAEETSASSNNSEIKANNGATNIAWKGGDDNERQQK